MSSGLPVSVVVPTRNSAATIAACLRSILDVLPDDGSEVVVVDSQSTDDTQRLVRELPVALVTVEPRFVASSRNVGVSRTRQPLILFVDSDCTVDRAWYRAIQDTLLHATAAADLGRARLGLRPPEIARAGHRRYGLRSGGQPGDAAGGVRPRTRLRRTGRDR
jgi:glycosyltransferase involved in cell wall biosynthesis